MCALPEVSAAVPDKITASTGTALLVGPLYPQSGQSTEAPENPTNSQSPDFTNKNCFLLEECDRFHGMVGTGTWSRNAVFSWSFLTGFLEVLRTAGQHP